MNAMNAINAMTKKQNNATTCNQPNGGENGGGKVTPAHYEELEELQLESVAGGKGGKNKKKEKNKGGGGRKNNDDNYIYPTSTYIFY